MGENRKLYPQNPINQYVTQFVEEFNGCLGCGFTQYPFKLCPRKEDKPYEILLLQEVWTHIPSTRKRPNPPFIYLPRSPT